MPIDPAHGRNIPSGVNFADVVYRFLQQTRQQFFDQVRQGYVPEFRQTELTDLSRQLEFLYTPFIRTGMRWSMRQIQREDAAFIRLPVASVAAPPKVPPINVFAPQMPEPPRLRVDLSRAFTLLHPTVPEQARRMSTEFINEFTQTTRNAVRDAIREGLEKGEALSQIQARLMGITEQQTIADRVESLHVFDRRRAATIGMTETSRAMHAGQATYGRSVGSWGLEWLASSDACPLCLSLNQTQVPHDTPFYVYPKGNPNYRNVWYPPAHPHCRCTAIDVFK